MAHGQETGSGKPALRQALQARGPELDLIPGPHLGPRHGTRRSRGRTHVSTRPRATPLLKISLAPQRASTHVAKFVSEPGDGRIGTGFRLDFPRVAVVKGSPAGPLPRPFSNFATG